MLILPSCSKTYCPLSTGDFGFSCSDFSTCMEWAIHPTNGKKHSPCGKVHVRVWLCGGGNDGSQGSAGLLTQQMGMFSFGYKEFHWDLRRGRRMNNVRTGNVKRESESNQCSCLSSCLHRRLACQSHLWFQHCRGVRIQWGSGLVGCQMRSEPVSTARSVINVSTHCSWHYEGTSEKMKQIKESLNKWMPAKDTGSCQWSKILMQSYLSSSTRRHILPVVTGTWVEEEKERKLEKVQE